MEKKKQELVTIQATASVPLIMFKLLREPSELEGHAKRILVGQLADHIIANIDSIPATYSVAYPDIVDRPTEEHTMELNIISSEELKRLRGFEDICRRYSFRSWKHTDTKRMREAKTCCWFCGAEMVWGGDHDFSDFDYEGDGVVTNLCCPNCEATAEFTTKMQEDEPAKAISCNDSLKAGDPTPDSDGCLGCTKRNKCTPQDEEDEEIK